MKAALLALLFGSALAYGQDAGMMAAQQAIEASQQAQQAAQQAIDQAQISSQQTTITNLQIQQTMANVSTSSSCPGPIVGAAIQPKFSIKKSGKVAAGTQLRIHSETHYATIYYTTDGWMPTAASTRYTGPITINATTHLEAVALAPNMLHSSVAFADYTVDAPAEPAAPQPPVVTDGVLRAGTTLRLVTNAETSSETAEVGDKIPLLLDQDVDVGDKVVIAKGTPVDGVLTIADPAGKRNIPGDLVFAVHTLRAGNTSIPIRGGETLEGQAGRKPQQVIIEPGMAVIAVVARETPIKP